VSKKELQRTASFYVTDGAQCSCMRQLLPSRGKKQSVSGTYLVMGRRVENQLTLTYMQKLDRKSNDMKRAIRAIGDVTVCNNGRQAITADDVTSRGGSGARKKSTPTSGRKTGSGGKSTPPRKKAATPVPTNTVTLSSTQVIGTGSRDQMRSTTTGSSTKRVGVMTLSTSRPAAASRKPPGTGKAGKASRRTTIGTTPPDV